jgi:hypothetical protein
VLAMPGAEAAPQALGLVASNGILTPLRCDAGLCSGVVSSFCLQYARPSPNAGDEYRLAEGGAIAIVGKRADGSTIRLSADDFVTIRSRAGFSSVTVSVPESQLRTMGVAKAALEIAPLASVLPVAVAGDSDPETPADIGSATGPERRLARMTFETQSPKGDAARVIALVVNSLLADEPTSPAGREAVWKAAMTLAAGAPLDPQGLVIASRIYRDCGGAVDAGFATTLDDCMEQAQQNLIGGLEFELEGQSAVAHGRGESASGS